MTIFEAAKQGEKICRSDGDNPMVIITPTNTPECCLMQVKGCNRIGVRWNPQLEDLLATNWEVYTDEKA